MREDEDERVKRRHHTPHPRDPESFIKKLPEVLRVEEDVEGKPPRDRNLS